MSNRVVMVGGSLLSFVDGFSPQEQQDIMNSLALAQYSAVNRPGFPRHSPGSLRNAFQTLPVTADC